MKTRSPTLVIWNEAGVTGFIHKLIKEQNQQDLVMNWISPIGNYHQTKDFSPPLSSKILCPTILLHVFFLPNVFFLPHFKKLVRHLHVLIQGHLCS